MPRIKEDIETASAWIAKALSSSGYQTDFSPQSLWEIDRFYDDNTRDGVPRGLLADRLGQKIFALGSYVGELIRRSVGGEWHGDDNDPTVELSVELRLPDGSVCWPTQRAGKRLKNGTEDSIAAYGVGLGLHIGEQPPPPKKGFFSRLFGG